MALSIRRTQFRTWEAEVPVFITGLAAASTVELLILRLLTRTAIHIPALEHFQQPYAWVSDGGRYAYFVTVALLIPGLVLLAMEFGRRSAVALTGVLLFVAGAGLAAAGLSQPAVLDVATIGAVVLIATAISAAVPSRVALGPALFGASFATAGVYSTLPTIAGTGAELQSTWLLSASEYTGLGFALSTPLLLRGYVPALARWVGVGVSLLALAVFLGNGSTSRFLLLWNVGLAGSLPSFLYAAAAGALALTLVGLWRAGHQVEAAGLLLLITGGIGLHNTYQSGLVVAGLAALYCGFRAEAEGTGQRELQSGVTPCTR